MTGRGSDSVDWPELSESLRSLGVVRGRDVLVHCSLRGVGPLRAGPATLLAAIQDAVGEDGTVVVPAQTPNNSITSPVFRAATRGLSRAQRAQYIAGMEGFDPAVTPSFGMGVFAEHVRQHPAASRSCHPQSSFAAVGVSAAELMKTHRLRSHLGERSPLAALYRRDAQVLLLGVGFDVCTAFHLAEYRLPQSPPIRRHRCFVQRDGARLMVDFRAPDLNDGDFGKLGEALEREPYVAVGRVGNAVAHLVPIRRAVDFAIAWMTEYR